MNHTHSLDFRGDLAAAFTLATATLTACGFNLVNKTSRSLEFTGRGLCSTRESALRGASRITITGGAGRIELAAELGGGRRVIVISGVVAAICVVQAVVFSQLAFNSARAFDWARVVPLTIPLLFGAVAGPLGFHFLRQRTIRALDTLLNNMVVSGRDT